MSKPQEPTQFTRESAERIARVVRAAELAVPQARPLTFDRIDPQRKIFRVCTFTGSWAIGSAKTVTFRNVTNTPNTVSAVNLFFPISSAPTATINCAVAKDGTAWYLVDVPLQTATAVFISSTQTAIAITTIATSSYVTDVTLSASLNTSSCSITIGKTLTTASSTFVTSTATAVRVNNTYTGTYLLFGY
jgi:hypothetical protein